MTTKMKTVMKWALCSREGFFTYITSALTADGGTKIVACTTRDPLDARIMVFDTHKALETVINSVEAAMAIPLDETLRRSSPFSGFVSVRIPCPVEDKIANAANPEIY